MRLYGITSTDGDGYEYISQISTNLEDFDGEELIYYTYKDGIIDMTDFSEIWKPYNGKLVEQEVIQLSDGTYDYWDGDIDYSEVGDLTIIFKNGEIISQEFTKYNEN